MDVKLKLLHYANVTFLSYFVKKKKIALTQLIRR